MIENYFKTITEFYRRDDAGEAACTHAQFLNKVQAYLPISDMVRVYSPDELNLSLEKNGGFVVVTMLADEPVDMDKEYPWRGYMGDYELMTGEYIHGAWSAVYARSKVEDDE